MISFQQFVVAVLFGLLMSYLSGLYWAQQEDKRRRRVYEFKVIYAQPLNAMQWSMFLGDKSKEGWEFVGVIYETVALTTEQEKPTFPKTIAVFRRLKLKGQ